MLSIGTAVHGVALNLADLTLLASNATIAIIMTQIFSMCILGEQFVCIYDFPALLLMSTGCFIIVANSIFSEPIERDINDIMSVLLSPLFILYVVIATALGLLGRHFLKNL